MKRPNRAMKKERRRAERAEESARVWERAAKVTEEAKAYIQEQVWALGHELRVARGELAGARENVERLQRTLARYRTIRVERDHRDGDIGLNLKVSAYVLRDHPELAAKLISEDAEHLLLEFVRGQKK